MTMEVENEERNGRVISLPQLQSLMRKDPEAYGSEFDQQWSHFESMVDIFKMKPQKPQKSFSEQVMFLAHVVPSFPKKGEVFPGVLISTLNEHFQVMHPEMRQTLVAALILLRNRGQFPLMRTLPLYFKLFTLQDKSLRKNIFSHIVKDLGQMHMTSRNQKVSGELRDFFFGQLKENDVEVARRACAVFISLYRSCCWRDAHTVNLVSAGLMHPDVKISAALAHLFLGNKTKGLEGILEDSEEENEKEEDTMEIHGLLGSKKTANRKKRIERARKAVKKAQTRRKKAHKNDSSVSFVAIDLLNDPQALADRLLQRVSKGNEPYLFRLLILHLIARLVGRHMLHLLNLYPYLIKYLSPSQREVTKFLACLVEAAHAQVPPDELRPVVKHLIGNFVNEAQAPEVIEVGINTIREVSSRAVSILTEDELTDLSGFRKFKHKGVAMAARSLINTYRELDPQLLHRSLRGREASMALSRGEVQERQFGNSDARDSIDGLELLAKDWQKKKQKPTAENGGEREEDGAKASPATSPNSEMDPKHVLTEQVLSADDFKRMRKIQLQKSIELQLGRKRKLEEISSSDSESESSEDSEDSGDERGLQGRLPDAMSAEELKGSKKKNRTKAARLASAQSGRVDFKEKLKERHANRKGGLTNKEQKRNKPIMMTMQSSHATRKKNSSSKQKMTNLKKHIGTLQKKVGGKAKRRR